MELRTVGPELALILVNLFDDILLMGYGILKPADDFSLSLSYSEVKCKNEEPLRQLFYSEDEDDGCMFMAQGQLGQRAPKQWLYMRDEEVNQYRLEQK